MNGLDTFFGTTPTYPLGATFDPAAYGMPDNAQDVGSLTATDEPWYQKAADAIYAPFKAINDAITKLAKGAGNTFSLLPFIVIIAIGFLGFYLLLMGKKGKAIV